MKISVFEVEEWEREAFQRLADDHDVRFEIGPLDADLAKEHADADVISPFIYSDLGAEVLEAFDNLDLIATRSTGFDHIDVGWCQEHHVTVANVPSYGENTVAEHVFALILALSHHVVEAADRTPPGRLLPGRPTGLRPPGAHDGRDRHREHRPAHHPDRRRLRHVLAFDVQQDENLARELGFRYVDMNELLGAADVVSLHVPGGEKTHHLMGEDQFRAMKRGAVLVNTSRGSVVDTRALLRALSDGTVASAGLDVVEEEPVVREEAELLRSVLTREHDLETLLSNHILLRMRNVLITPHSAFNTREAVKRILDTTCENIAAFSSGDARNVVP